MRRSPVILGHSGYRPSFDADAANPCPGCGKSHWIVGRLTAECAFCATALPIAAGGMATRGWFAHAA